MNTTLLRRRSLAALAVAALALTTLTGITAATAQASTAAAKAKSSKACPLTNDERAGYWWAAPPNALDFMADTLYSAPGKPIVIDIAPAQYFGSQPIGKLVVSTKRGPRTVVNFCANRDGSMKVVFPADTVTGTATITMSPREKKPDPRDVYRKTVKVVALNAVPPAPTDPTNIQAQVRSDGVLFTWTPTSAVPAAERYLFSCDLPVTRQSQVLATWDTMNRWTQGGVFPLNISTKNMSGFTELKTGWRYDPERRTVTRAY